MSRLWVPRQGQDLTFVDKFLGPILLLGGVFLELLGCVVIWKICDIEV
jgi:Flp pilus assembly protein TadB